jgi:hypothetical protein
MQSRHLALIARIGVSFFILLIFVLFLPPPFPARLLILFLISFSYNMLGGILLTLVCASSDTPSTKEDMLDVMIFYSYSYFITPQTML